MEIETFRELFFTAAVIFPRMAAVFWTVPFLSRQILPGFVKNSIIMCFMPILFPLILPQMPGQIDSVIFFIFILLKEVFIGFMIGFIISIIFWVAENVGILIDYQRGGMMTVMFNPLAGAQVTPWGNLLFQLITILFFISGGFIDLLHAVFESYRVWPIFSFYPEITETLVIFMLKQADIIMKLSVVISAPIVIACFVSEFGLGLVNRFAPQLNVFFLSMPIKSAVGAIMLILYITTLMTTFKRYFISPDTLLTYFQTVFE